MALSIKAGEADRLAREPVGMTGDTITEAVTVALRQRCERERARFRTPEQKLADIDAFSGADQRPLRHPPGDEARVGRGVR
jgi:antitoxin VapB